MGCCHFHEEMSSKTLITFSLDRGERHLLLAVGRFTISVALSTLKVSKSIPDVAKAAAMAAAAAARPGGGSRESSSAFPFDVGKGLLLRKSLFSPIPLKGKVCIACALAFVAEAFGADLGAIEFLGGIGDAVAFSPSIA
jgi:hypothetical protein